MTSLRILIVDDNPNDRTLALREVKKLFPQLQAWEISDETSFVEALEQNKFDLVITDYQLRWTTGLDILQRIKNQKPECPVIMFTGTGSEEIAVSAMKAGLDDYVVKSPKHYVRLAAAVRSAAMRSQQKKTLEEFKQSYYRFFERVPLGLYRLDPSGAIIEANSTLVKMLGYSQQKDLQGKTIADYHLELKSYLQWQQQLEGKEAVAEFEGQIKSHDGKLIWVRHHAIVVKDARDNLICYEGAVTDITASKRAELERIELLDRERQARKEAETLNLLKDEFLATLSHELRTPLNAIVGWTQLLCAGRIGESQINNVLQTINRNALAQNQLIDNLLDVSHIIRGTVKLNFKPVDLVAVVMASVDTVSPTAEAKNIKINTRSDLPTVKINADEERLRQVFWNLSINAVKFTPEGGSVNVTITIQSKTAVVTVRDTGQGIAADVLPYIFDRFRQAETKSSTRTKGGLGLGLAIARYLVEIHGGKIIAESEGIGKGSSFIVELPLLDSDRRGTRSIINPRYHGSKNYY